MKKFTTLCLVMIVAIFAATYAASCHCSSPSQPPSLSGGGAGGGVAQSSNALTILDTADADLAATNRGYGHTLDTSVSAGSIRRVSTLPDFGLAHTAVTLEGWRQTDLFQNGRRAAAAIVHENYIYLSGGFDGNTYGDIQSAKVDTEGRMGWSNAGTLPHTLCAHASVVAGDRLYIIGGWVGFGQVYDEVWSAPIAGGQVGTWRAERSLPALRRNVAASVHDGILFLTGGVNAGGTALADVISSVINEDGTLGVWTSRRSLPFARWNHGGAAYGGYLYAVGGFDSTGSSTQTVYYAPINADGSLGQWGEGNNLSLMVNGVPAVAYNGYLYVIGGPGQDKVMYAPINPGTGATGAWSYSPAFTTARLEHATVVLNGYLYIIGGWTGSAHLSDVQFAPIRPDGGVGSAWAASGPAAGARDQFGSAYWNGRVYMTGGYNGNIVVDDVLIADVGEDGMVGGWVVSPSKMNFPRRNHASFAYNGFLYAVAGIGVAGQRGDVEYAAINQDGSLGQWQIATNSMVNVREGHAVTVWNGNMYVLGGKSNATYRSDVLRAPLNPGGDIGPFVQSTAGFTNGRWGHQVVARHGSLVMLGGCDSDPCDAAHTYNQVRYATIDATGESSAWSNAAVTLPEKLAWHKVAMSDNHIYVTGGYSDPSVSRNVYRSENYGVGGFSAFEATAPMPKGIMQHGAVSTGTQLVTLGGNEGPATAPLNAVQSAPLNTNGVIGPVNTTSSLPPGGVSWTAAATAYGALYIGGGWIAPSESDLVRFAPIQGDGTLGNWTASFNRLAIAVEQNAMVAYNGFLYVIGGLNSGASKNNVQYAKLNSDHSFGAWTNTSPLLEARRDLVAVAYHDWLYAISGFGSGYLVSIERAAINGDGTLGTWQTLSTTVPVALMGAAAAVHGGRLYLLGGENGGTVRGNIYAAPVLGDGTLGTFVDRGTIPSARRNFFGGIYNGVLVVAGGNDGNSELSGTYYNAINPDGSLGVWSNGPTLPVANSAMAGAMGGGYMYLAGGYSAGSSVYYARVGAPQASTKSGFSKVYDIGVDGWFNSISVSGIAAGEGSALTVAYRVATVTDPRFGPWHTYTGRGSLGFGLTAGDGTGRWLELAMTLDDGGRLGMSNGTGSSEIHEINIFTDVLGTGGACNASNDCTSGFCVAGLCCPTACSTPTECQETGACTTGTCNYPSKPSSTACTDADPGDCWDAMCDGNGACDQRARARTATPCTDDGLGCTDDLCSNDGAGTCTHPVKPGTCHIGTVCFNDGNISVTNECAVCDPARNPGSWSSRPDGTPCVILPPGPTCVYGACEAGVCAARVDPGFCLINGSCFASGYVNGANTCDTCRPVDSQAAWSVNNTGGCDDGDNCTRNDTCVAGTRGTCSTGGAACWNNAECTSPGTCVGATSNYCRGTAYTCTPKECETISQCDGSGGCTGIPANQGTPCTADALSCTSDQCDGQGSCAHKLTGGGCLIGGVCFGGGVSNPDNSCQYCAGSSPNAWTNFPNGNDCDDKDPCTSNTKCDGAGNCTGGIPACGCTVDAQCAAQPVNKHCDSGAHNCVQCLSDGHCKANEFCNPVTKKCQPAPTDGGTDAGGDAGTDGGKDGGADAGGGCRQNPTICQGTGREICDTVNDRCVVCLKDSDCDTAKGETCETSTNTCTGGATDGGTDAEKDAGTVCSINSDCGGETPFCRLSDHTCVECLTATECALKDTRRPLCRSGSNTCVECIIDATCRPGQTCDATGTCVGQVADGGTDGGAECTIDHHCTDDALPVCNTATRRCVQCLVDADCSDGYYCDANDTCVSKQQADGGTAVGEDAGPAAGDAGGPTETLNPYGCACTTVRL